MGIIENIEELEKKKELYKRLNPLEWKWKPLLFFFTLFLLIYVGYSYYHILSLYIPFSFSFKIIYVLCGFIFMIFPNIISVIHNRFAEDNLDLYIKQKYIYSIPKL